MADVVVTAVTAEPLWDTTLVSPGRARVERAHHMRRYVLTLDGCSDPITFIAKQTNVVEALLYNALGEPAATGIVPCHYAHVDGDASWVILEDVPDDFPPPTWQPAAEPSGPTPANSSRPRNRCWADTDSSTPISAPSR